MIIMRVDLKMKKRLYIGPTIIHNLHPTKKHNMPHSSGTTTSTTTTTRLLEFTPRQNALRARYADRVAQEARRIQTSARRIAPWNARIRKANKRLNPTTTANEEEGHSQIEFGWRLGKWGFSGTAYYAESMAECGEAVSYSAKWEATVAAADSAAEVAAAAVEVAAPY